jgi:hypothetical protein
MKKLRVPTARPSSANAEVLIPARVLGAVCEAYMGACLVSFTGAFNARSYDKFTADNALAA